MLSRRVSWHRWKSGKRCRWRASSFQLWCVGPRWCCLPKWSCALRCSWNWVQTERATSLSSPWPAQTVTRTRTLEHRCWPSAWSSAGPSSGSALPCPPSARWRWAWSTFAAGWIPPSACPIASSRRRKTLTSTTCCSFPGIETCSTQKP